MWNKFNVNDTAYIVVSNRVIREVKVLSYSGGFYTIKFVKGNGGIRLRENRLFITREEAEKSLPQARPKSPAPAIPKRHPTPWD